MIHHQLHFVEKCSHPCLVHHHRPMDQHPYSPIMHHASPIRPVTIVTSDQDSKLQLQTQHLSRGSMTPALAAFQRTTHTSPCRTRRGKWGPLHVSIAWKIFHHKQLQEMQKKLNRHRGDLTPEDLSSISPKEQLLACRRPYPASPHGQSTERSRSGDRGLTGVSTSSPESRPKSEKAEEPVDMQRTETLPDETHANQRSHGKSKDLTQEDKANNLKQETIDEQFPSLRTGHNDPSAFNVTHAWPFACTPPEQHVGHLSVWKPNSGRFRVSSTSRGFLPYPASDWPHYQTASWEQRWDVNKRKALSYRQGGSTTPLVPHRHRQHFYGFLAPSVLVPVAVRNQEAAYIRGRDAAVLCSVCGPDHISTSAHFNSLALKLW